MNGTVGDDLDLRMLATRHRALTYCVLGIVLANALIPIFPLFPILCAILTVFVVKVLVALRVNRRTIVLACVGMFVPVASMVILLAVAWKASAVLQRAGVRVGLFGTRPEEMVRYAHEHHRCLYCWADMSSSRTGYCPACGLRA